MNKSTRIRNKSKRRKKNIWVIYGTNWCKWCKKAKQLAKSKKLNYVYIDIDSLTDKEFIGLSVKSKEYKFIPKIFYNNKFIGGYDKMSKIIKIKI